AEDHKPAGAPRSLEGTAYGPKNEGPEDDSQGACLEKGVGEGLPPGEPSDDQFRRKRQPESERGNHPRNDPTNNQNGGQLCGCRTDLEPTWPAHRPSPYVGKKW